MNVIGAASTVSSALPGDVLVVEDDPLIALDFAETVYGMGVPSVRTAAAVSQALELIVERAPDFAFLDVELMQERSFAIAERLEVLAVPFAFVTGHARESVFPARFLKWPVLAKPCPRDTIEATLRSWRSES